MAGLYLIVSGDGGLFVFNENPGGEGRKFFEAQGFIEADEEQPRADPADGEP